MIFSSLRKMLVALAALLVIPAGLTAQGAPAPQAEMPEQVRSWLTEMQGIHQRLESIQQQALQDPQLVTQQQELGESIKTAMEKIDPSLNESMSRVQDLEVAAQAAQQEGDQAKLQQLAQEAQQIQQRFLTAQEQALQQPELASQVTAFQTRLEQKMAEVDPEASKLIERFRELESKITESIPAG